MLPIGHQPVPMDLLAALRDARELDLPAQAGVLNGLGLRVLSGGHNNHVYAWNGPGGPICIKLYKVDERFRPQREWHALTLLANREVADVPRPLWREQHDASPAIGMTLLPGISIPDLPDPAARLGGLVETWRQIHSVPVSGTLAELVRIDSPGHYAERITDIWTKQLAENQRDPLTRDLEHLLDRWWDSGDRRVLAEPQPPAFSRGDANLLNWLYDSELGRTACVDFEYSGTSDPSFDAADLVEHISGRIIDDQTWASVVLSLGIAKEQAVRRFQAAQRTCALRWLAVLWKQRKTRAEEFSTQLDRVRSLQQSPFRL